MIGSLVGGAIGLGGQIAGLVGSAKANKERQKLINSRRNDIQNWFDKDYNQDFLATQESRSAMKHISDKLREKSLAQDSTNAIMGGSAEASVAQKGRNNEVYADVVNNLAAKGTAIKENAKHEYRAGMAGVDAQQQQLNQEKGNNWTKLGEMAGGVGESFAQADAIGAFDPTRPDNIASINPIAAKSVTGGMSDDALNTALQNKIKL